MRVSIPISFSKQGISFKNNKYDIFFPWWNPFHYSLAKYDNTPVPYASSSKLCGMEYHDLISEWVSFKYPNNHVIVLSNINVGAKNIQFWAKVPNTDMPHFVKDLVVLYCQDPREVVRLVENIPPSFADASGYSAGDLIINNKEFA